MASSSTTRKVWVRRPGASATLVSFNENDVVDDIREMLLRKYGNSLGRVYDAPDITLRLTPRHPSQGDRTLGPDELMTRTLDVFYPGGQTMEEALVIDVPIRRVTPNVSPRGGPPHASHVSSAHRESHSASHHAAGDPRVDYFGPGVVPGYYNHGPLTAESAYGSTLGPESAYTRPSGSQHLYLTGSGHHHSQSHKHGHPRSPTGGSGSGAASALQSGSGGPGGSPLNHPHSISILATGQAPPMPNLPSPGGSRRSQKERYDRPHLDQQLSVLSDNGTGSGLDLASQMNNGHAVSSNGLMMSSGQKGQISGGQKVSMTAPAGRGMIDGLNLKGKGGVHAHDGRLDKDGTGSLNGALINGGGGSMGVNSGQSVRGNTISPPRPMSPMRSKKKKASGASSGGVPARPMDDGRKSQAAQLGPLTVPPINVLIVEDNIINLKLLEAFVKRLKVRWQTAMNGVDAVAKWRSGGFHLVLMDIQLPLMSGLEATREIRRLERINSIGVFASTPSDSIGAGRDPRSDKLANIGLFKSPVIIVALTASSLQSDRNDALAAGCNDFLTKPVNFLWLEKKIMEWGCMQALIDFDGWRKWKELKLPLQEANEGGGFDASSKRSKKASGHNKRPSASSFARDKTGGDSSDTVNTLSSAGSPPIMTPSGGVVRHGASSSGSGSGSASGTTSVNRSPYSQTFVPERLAASGTSGTA